jgi:ankyrin repeat protein
VTDQYGTAAVWDVYYSDSEGQKSLQDILKEMVGQVEAEEIETARILLSNGANVNVRDQDGKTVLFYAKSENHPHLVAELEKAGGTE